MRKGFFTRKTWLSLWLSITNNIFNYARKIKAKITKNTVKLSLKLIGHASGSKRGFAQNLSYENEFCVHGKNVFTGRTTFHMWPSTGKHAIRVNRSNGSCRSINVCMPFKRPEKAFETLVYPFKISYRPFKQQALPIWLIYSPVYYINSAV